MGIYKVKGSPYFHYAFTLKGCRYRGSTQAEKRADAETVYANERRRVLLGEAEQPTITLEYAFDKYEEEHAMFLAHYPSVQAHVNHALKHFGKSTPMHEIDQNAMERYIAKCRAETYTRSKGGKEFKLSSATINRRLATFQGMHRRAKDSWKVRVGQVDFRALKLKEKTVINNTLTEAQAHKLCNAAPVHIRHFIMISLHTGWRMANVLSLKGKQIDLDTMTIQTIGKRGKLITTPITESLHQYIMAHQLHEKPAVCAIVFSKSGVEREVKSIKTAWKKLFADTGIKYIRRHDLRHTFGTWLYEATGDQRLVQESLHHSDMKTSLRYTHTKMDLQRAKLNKAMTFKTTLLKDCRNKKRQNSKVVK